MNRIMIMIPELFYGGAEKQFRAIISGIKQEYDVIVVDEHLYGNEDTTLKDIFLQQNEGIKYIELKKRRFNRIIKYLLINIDMIVLLLKNSPNIVFASSLKLAVLCKMMRIPFVYSERNSAEGKAYYRQKKELLLLANRVTCNSKSACIELCSHGIDAQYIANGIEECEMLEQNRDMNRIIVPARISSEKNQEVVLEAMRFLPKLIKITFVGKTTDDDYLEILKRRIRDLELENRVEIFDYSNNIRNLYEDASIVVLPSLTEGLSNVILESYMFGRICVLSDISQNRSVGSINQRYFDPRSAKELSEKIIEVLNLNQSEYNQERLFNHHYVVSCFGMGKMVDNYKKIFREVAYTQSHI